MLFRSMRDPEVIAAARNAETFAGRRMHPSKTVLYVGWLPDKEGVTLTLTGACGSCHHQPANGTGVSGAPGAVGPGGQPFASANQLRDRLRNPARLDGGGPFLDEGPIGLRLFQAYAAPWSADSNPDAWKRVGEQEWLSLRTA